MNCTRMIVASLLGLCLLTASASPVRANPVHTAPNVTRLAVAQTIAAADPGDTVLVPAGSATWDESLVITKGIILKGAGIGQTVITSNISATKEYQAIIQFLPASPQSNDPFRVTGFTLDCNEMTTGIYLYQGTDYILDRVRIDHNRITYPPRGSFTARGILIKGNVFGVIDNNEFEVREGKSIDAYGLFDNQWAMNLDRSFGLSNRMFYEDNTFRSGHTFHSTGHGGRYVIRYNNYTFTDDHTLTPIFDMHGNQPNGDSELFASMVGEIYGNTINLGSRGGTLLGQRGGQAVVFNNTVNSTTSVSSSCREEYRDNLIGHDYLMHVTNSYYWENYKNGTTRINATITLGEDWENGLVENVDFFNQQTSFDGSVGMGVGLLANRPASCTLEGAGYWATDENTLYRWHNGAWEFLFTPYTYPHPLRTEGPTADLAVTAFDVQQGIQGRSFVRYVDLTFNTSEGAAELISGNRVRLSKYPLDGAGRSTPVSLMGVMTANGNQLNLDFGPKGLGGAQNTTAADGYYDLTLDLDGDGQFETHRRFYRLLGDVNGDHNVTVADANLILRAYRQSGPLLNEDANGDGVVNALDRTMAARSLNRKLADGLAENLDD